MNVEAFKAARALWPPGQAGPGSQQKKKEFEEMNLNLIYRALRFRLNPKMVQKLKI